jgi:DNA polymerase-3 subunit epsilon
MTGQADLFGELGAEAGIVVPPTEIRVPRKAKGRAFALDPADREAAAAELEACGDYRVLRLLSPRLPRTLSALREGERLAVIVDTETTGLDHTKDEIIEIGMVALAYTEDEGIGEVTGAFSALQEPTKPVPPDITRLTGITDEMVRGQVIDRAAVEAFIEPAHLVIAHNAKFDRPFCERLAKGFTAKAWACSQTEVPWKDRGFEGTKLGYLIAQCGKFHRGHRAVDDCHALLEVLASSVPGTKSAFAALLANARQSQIRIWAEGSPFEMKDELKKRGYRWNDGVDGRPKCWWTDVKEEAHEAEIQYLREAIYRRDIEPFSQRITAFERFKVA